MLKKIRRRDAGFFILGSSLSLAFNSLKPKIKPESKKPVVVNQTTEFNYKNYPYFYQLDNEIDSYGSCALTSVAISLGHFGKTVSPDSLYLECQKRGLDRFSHLDIKKLLHEYEIEDNWSTEHKWADVFEHLKKGFPVIFSSQNSFTASGHVIVLLFFEEPTCLFICHDPYGRFKNPGYDNSPTAGKFVKYSEQLIYTQADNGNLSTWAHLIKPYAPLKRVIGDENCSKQFKNRVRLIANNINCDPSDLMAIMSFESGGSFSSAVKNQAGSGAVGLIQFMPQTAASLGTSTEALAKMTAIGQLDWVEKYFLAQLGADTSRKSLSDLYMAVLWPAAIGKTLNYGLFTRPGIAYNQNSGLDVNRDGIISIGEAIAKVQARFVNY
ncbi:C39 family peptidase [Gloeothece verrucosa]|uniref:Peptidase C39-like domain-containing protein n=1 Tax=Gloeothece verrucosa (strain PCC 7822) TaxID=497965 RepID=E0UD04_GLOV7|nr:C39 family peptidase [Gloeothece verrucosa]ADN16469.1 hypothetical protein Cyan7822_4560 [Gloeothece verrucosa PCC 7822]